MIRFFLLKQQQVAAGFGLFGSGYTGATANAETSKYKFASNSWIAGTNLLSVLTDRSSASNLETGLFGGGRTTDYNYQATVHKYAFSADTVSAGTSLLYGRNVLSACGNASVAIFGGGYYGIFSVNTDKYTYSNNSVVAGTGLSGGNDGAAANSEFGLFAGGPDQSASTKRYKFSDDTTSSILYHLSVGRSNPGVTGNQTIAIIGGGYRFGNSNVSDKYTYSSNTISGATYLVSAIGTGVATGNATIGLFFQGDIYTYATDVISSATSLVNKSYSAACSSTPGHL